MRKGLKQFVMALIVMWMAGVAIVIPARAEGRTQDQEYQQGIRDLEMETGSLALTLTDGGEKGRRLPGGVFAVYKKADGKKVKELVTDKDGRAGAVLPPGDYTLQEAAAPKGYCLSGEALDVSVQPGEIWELAFSNEKEAAAGRESLNGEAVFEEEPDGRSTGAEGINGKEDSPEAGMGILQILNAGEGTGEKLSGGVFAAYENSGKKIGEIVVQAGRGELPLPAGDYYLREREAPAGYLVEDARILFCIREGEVTLAEITSERDKDYLVGRNPQEIIPKTGEGFPAWRYALAAACFGAAALCGFYLRRR